MEQRCHELSHKLKVSELNVKELEDYSRIEEQHHKATSRLKETEERAQQLEEVCVCVCLSVCGWCSVQWVVDYISQGWVPLWLCHYV